MSDLRRVWQKIVRWHQEHLPESLRDDERSRALLGSGTSAQELAAAEEVMGLRLPTEIRASYLLHDGSNGYSILPWGYHLLSIAQVAETWRTREGMVAEGVWDEAASKPEGPIKPVHWNARWVPVSHNHGGDHQCADLDPAPGGVTGQVIKFNHEVGPVRVLAEGFGAWLRDYAEDLEAGRYRYDPDELWVVPVR